MRLWNGVKQLLSGEPRNTLYDDLRKAAMDDLRRAPSVDRFDARVQNRTQGELRSELVSFGMLRELAGACDAVANAIQVRVDQIRSTPFAIQAMPDADDEEAKAQVAEAENFFATSGGFGGPGMTFDDMLCVLTGDMLELGCTALYRRPNKGGGTYSVEYVDAATIKPLLTDGGWAPLPPEPAFQQYDGQNRPTDRKFTTDEMRYLRFRARSNSRWGRSPTENVLAAIAQYIGYDSYNGSWLRDGDGEWAYWKTPTDWTPEQIKQFDAYVQAVNKARAGKAGAATRSMPAGPERVNARQRGEAQFEKSQVHLVRRIARAFSLSAAVLGFEGAQYKVSAEESSKSAELWGENVLKLKLKGLFDDILRDDLGLGLVEFVWQDEEQDLSPVASVIAQVGTERVSPNKARELLGLPPAEGPLVDALYTVLGSGQVVVVGWEPGATPPQVDVAGQQEPDTGAVAAKADLSRWERKALRMLGEGGLEKCSFESSFIPEVVADAVSDSLSKAQNADDVRAAFAVYDSPAQPLVPRLAGDIRELLSAVRCERGRREGF